MQVLSIGEVLWDVFPHTELLGGAPLNFSANVVRLGDRAALVSAVGNDARGHLTRKTMASLGLDCAFVNEISSTPTGVAIVHTSPTGEPSFEIPRPAAFDLLDVSPESFEAAKRLAPDWLYFGTLSQMTPHVEATIRRLHEGLPGARAFYDMNLRPGAWTLALVQRLSAMANILKLNEFEAETLAGLTGTGTETFSLERFCAEWSGRYGIRTICVTLGPAGCLVYENGVAQTVPGYPATVHDTVGAGDAFAAAFLHGYHRQWPILRTARFANAVGSIVASRPGATPLWSLDEALALASGSIAGIHAEGQTQEFQ